ncbi:MAG: glutamate 5-kinase [Deltaproteobacteria bacterium]|nr:MAG: glutamate 5-kinase [Deltaproteobacteria bacterium]
MRDFSKAKRIVIKVGTNVLSKENWVDKDFLRVIARQIAGLVKQNRQVILVTSGAIGMGTEALGIRKQLREVKMRQACAAVGQGILMHEYQEAFRKYGQKVAQVLLTNRIMSQRRNYLNLKNTVETLLGMSVVPIVNENDCVSIEEIDLAFGDNDRLSALMASKIDAELLIILTDVEGLYDGDPKDRKAKLIPVVKEVTEEIAAMAGRAGSKYATGGMASKIEAIRIAANAGCEIVLAHGREKDVILRILNGEEIGTLFLPKRRLSNRKRWILNSMAKGVIEVDPGAAKAIRDSRSLLLVGITKIRGDFSAGDVVNVGDVAKGVSKFSARQLRDMLMVDISLLKSISQKQKAIIHANDMVIHR